MAVHHPVVAAERQFEAAAKGCAMNRGNDRFVESLDTGDHFAQHFHALINGE